MIQSYVVAIVVLYSYNIVSYVLSTTKLDVGSWLCCISGQMSLVCESTCFYACIV